MDITVNWLEPEKKHVCYHFQGMWTWQNVFHVIDEAVALLDTVEYPVFLPLCG